MKKNVWIFLFAVLLPSVVLGWLALRSAEEQQIVFERRTAELYQKETDSLAVTVRDTVDAERRAFGETVHRLLAKGDAEALARDFTNTKAFISGLQLPHEYLNIIRVQAHNFRIPDHRDI